MRVLPEDRLVGDRHAFFIIDVPFPVTTGGIFLIRRFVDAGKSCSAFSGLIFRGAPGIFESAEVGCILRCTCGLDFVDRCGRLHLKGAPFLVGHVLIKQKILPKMRSAFLIYRECYS